MQKLFPNSLKVVLVSTWNKLFDMTNPRIIVYLLFRKALSQGISWWNTDFLQVWGHHCMGFCLIGSREAAFTYGVTSAGVAYSVAASCARGNITSCGCLAPRRSGSGASGYSRRGSGHRSAWKWSGCSVDIGFGLTFARRFLDSREVEGDPRSLMNLHNNRAGRTVSIADHLSVKQ